MKTVTLDTAVTTAACAYRLARYLGLAPQRHFSDTAGTNHVAAR